MDILNGKCHIVQCEGKIRAVFYYAMENDEDYNKISDGSWRNDRAYGVVHRIAVAADSHNLGLAGICIGYAVDKCKRSGIFDLRMDTHMNNIPMQKFLEKHDFRRCGIVNIKDGGERVAYHKVIIKNVIFDIGQVLLEFNWRAYMENDPVLKPVKDKLINATMANMKHWDENDRGVWSDEEFIARSIEIEPDIPDEIRYYMENVGKIIKEYKYSTPLIRKLKSMGYKVYILSNYGRRHFQQVIDHMSFLQEVDGRVVSYEVGLVKPEAEIFHVIVDKYCLNPSECVFLDDRADNIEAAVKEGMSGIVFDNIEQAVEELSNKLCEKVIYE